ncbi:MAG: hypothetical protein GY792_11050 [Gammaproteobacteria bacterium]|nr:hypothetical protein [Gammaproteobacteria bacterium]
MPNRFIRDGHSVLSQETLHIPQAQTRTTIEPNGVTDDFWWEPVSMVQLPGIFHAGSLADLT